MKLMVGLALVVMTTMPGEEATKVFSDKGSFFIRADKSKHPLAVGTELRVTSDAAGTRSAGSAIVMEVNGALVRITLDDEATKAKTRYVKLPAAETPPPAPPAPAAESATPPPAAPPPAPRLIGKLTDGMRVEIRNLSDTTWTDCELRYDDGRYYKLGTLRSKTDDTVLNVRFSSPPSPPEPAYDHVRVTCDQGETKFFFSNPHSPGALKGYAENAGGGRVVIHNTGETDWHRCNVVKPDGTQYLMKRLDANDQDSIRSGAFEKAAEPAKVKATQLSLRCKQGELTIPVK